ncbi:MAG: TonB family protein, partial [Gammaproteobacteria bacterium]
PRPKPEQRKPAVSDPPEVTKREVPPKVDKAVEKPKQKQARKPQRKKAASPASAASQKEIARAEASYRSKVRSLIESKKYYPARARRKRSTGEVHISFSLLRDGSVRNLRVSRPSGASVLDRAAMEAVKKVGRFPPFPQASKRTSWEFTVPLHYRLPR